jgi:hypothetical protein
MIGANARGTNDHTDLCRADITVGRVFVALTSLLGALKNVALAPRPSNVACATVGFVVAVWLFFLSYWVWRHP